MSDHHPGFRLNGPPPPESPLHLDDAAREDIARQGYIDHEERARRRMAELRALMGDEFETGGDLDEYRDRFHVEPPPGWSYNWKTFSVFNKEFPNYMSDMIRNGWQPVESGRHRHLTYPGYKDTSIITDGLMLMERPLELTKQRQLREIRKATDQVRVSESKLVEAPAGTGPRDAHRKTMPRLGNTIGPIGVPE